MKQKVFIVDPQARGIGSLVVYDYSLFSRMTSFDYTFYGNSDFNLKNDFHNLNFVSLFNYHKFSGILKGLSYAISMIALLFIVLFKRPLALHIEWIRLWPVDYLIYWIIRFFTSTKLIYTMHNILPHDYKESDIQHYRKLYHLMDCIIVHTENSKQELLKRFPEVSLSKLFVIPHGLLQLHVNEEEVKNSINEIKRRYVLHDKLVFTIVGSQSKYKGTDLLIEAWMGSELLRNNDNIRLIVAGKFAKDIVPNNIAENMILDNRLVSESEFVAYIRIADVLVLPYRAIDQSGVLLTVFNECTPYCATDVGELCKPFEIADIGWKIDKASVDDIKKRLLYLVANIEEVKMKKTNKLAWRSIQDLYDWDVISQNTERLYS